MPQHLVKEFTKYTLVGGLATMADWGTFYTFSFLLHWHYYMAFVMAYAAGITTHYGLNKKYTFKRKRFNLKKQLPMYALAMGLSFSLSFFLMRSLVDIFQLHLMMSKVLTTAVMLIFNYLIHKYISFNPSWEIDL